MNERYIIFADDDADDLELLTGYFKQMAAGISLKEFKDGKEVLKFLEDVTSSSENLPVLIVLDINMPRMDGMDVLSALRKHQHYGNIPVVIYTTSMTRTNMQLCKDLDATWMIKPNSVDEIKQTAQILADFCQSNISG